jgi:hypothetical protein
MQIFRTHFKNMCGLWSRTRGTGLCRCVAGKGLVERSLSFEQSGRDTTITLLSFINVSTVRDSLKHSLLTKQKELRFTLLGLI